MAIYGYIYICEVLHLIKIFYFWHVGFFLLQKFETKKNNKKINIYVVNRELSKIVERPYKKLSKIFHFRLTLIIISHQLEYNSIQLIYVYTSS